MSFNDVIICSEMKIFSPRFGSSVNETSTSTSTLELEIHQQRPPTTLSNGDSVVIRMRKYPAALSMSLIASYFGRSFVLSLSMNLSSSILIG